MLFSLIFVYVKVLKTNVEFPNTVWFHFFLYAKVLETDLELPNTVESHFFVWNSKSVSSTFAYKKHGIKQYWESQHLFWALSHIKNGIKQYWECLHLFWALSHTKKQREQQQENRLLKRSERVGTPFFTTSCVGPWSRGRAATAAWGRPQRPWQVQAHAPSHGECPLFARLAPSSLHCEWSGPQRPKKTTGICLFAQEKSTANWHGNLSALSEWGFTLFFLDLKSKQRSECCYYPECDWHMKTVEKN